MIYMYMIITILPENNVISHLAFPPIWKSIEINDPSKMLFVGNFM